MSRAHKEESGFTLVELLVAATLMIIVLGAVLTALETFQSSANVNTKVNDSQDEARRGIDLITKELRNLASPTNEQPQALSRAQPHDLVVQAVAATRPVVSLNVRNTEYVRYCYATASKLLYRQRLTWTSATDSAAPTATACPGGGWSNTKVVGSNIVNGARSLFTYNSATLTEISEISTTLWVDPNPGVRPAEVTIQGTVFLRNQNRKPTARFSAARSGSAILLNGTESLDPEERSLRYFWYDPAVSTTVPVGEGIVYEYTPAIPGPHNVYLIVKDPADLSAQAANQTVCVPGGTVTC